MTPSSRRQTRHGLGTIITLRVFDEYSDAPLQAAFDLIAYYETQLTINRASSQIIAINQQAGIAPVKVSSGVFTLVQRAVQASQAQFGFNALLGPLVKTWQIGFSDAHVPTDEQINARLPLTDPQGVSLDPRAHTVFLRHEGMQLDLGGIAKGFIADRIKNLWQAYGVSAGIIDLGGNLLFVGDSPKREDGQWLIGIQDPLKPRHHNIGRVQLPACSAVTSGIYERVLTVGDQQYHHLLDPATGRPKATPLASVTVFSHDSIEGELEAKRLFFAGRAIPHWGRYDPDLYGAVLVYQDHHVETIGIDLLPD